MNNDQKLRTPRRHPALPRTARRLALTGLALAASAGLAGCAYPPPDTPSFTALPGRGKPYAEFQHEDAYCRSVAYQSSGGANAQQNAVANGVGSAALGTVVGAGAGALLGAAVHNPGAGAAIGAGTGLAFGSVAGAGAADETIEAQQHRFDQTYAQCMVAYGNLVPVPQPSAGAYGYPYPGPYGEGGPVVVGPAFGVGFGYRHGYGY